MRPSANRTPTPTGRSGQGRAVRTLTAAGRIRPSLANHTFRERGQEAIRPYIRYLRALGQPVGVHYRGDVLLDPLRIDGAEAVLPGVLGERVTESDFQPHLLQVHAHHGVAGFHDGQRRVGVADRVHHAAVERAHHAFDDFRIFLGVLFSGDQPQAVEAGTVIRVSDGVYVLALNA